MASYTNNLLQALSGMSYLCKGLEVDLIEKEENSVRNVVDLYHVSGLSR